VLLNKASARLAFSNVTWKRPAERKHKIDALLDELLARGVGRLTVDQYRAALGGGVGLRQAQLDLAAHPRLRAQGNTRARYFVVAKRRSSS
jgi:hypothetical protein